jgi:hypothetical protein
MGILPMQEQHGQDGRVTTVIPSAALSSRQEISPKKRKFPRLQQAKSLCLRRKWTRRCSINSCRNK